MFASHPVVPFPDSVTHWTCPEAEADGTHHVVEGCCVHCGKSVVDLAIEQVALTQSLKGPELVSIVTAECFVCKKGGEVKLTLDQYNRLRKGSYIQGSLPDVAPEIREQLITGMHGDCWDRVFRD